MLFLFLWTGTACKQNVAFEKLVKQQLEQLFPVSSLRAYHCIVLIPNGGCTGCVLQAEDYFLHHQADDETLFIFTNFPSRKDLAIKLGKEAIGRTNVWLDSHNQLYFPQCAESIYPCAIYIEEGRVTRFANLDELLPEG